MQFVMRAQRDTVEVLKGPHTRALSYSSSNSNIRSRTQMPVLPVRMTVMRNTGNLTALGDALYLLLIYGGLN